MKHKQIFLPDIITINQVSKNIDAKITENEIIIHDTSITLNKGDVLSRKLPNNTIEKYEVISTFHKTGLTNKAKKKVLPDSIKIKYQKL